MPDHLQSFQLDFLTPDLFSKIVKKAITKGNTLPAAHGNYINFHMGDKPVGPGEKGAGGHIGVAHGKTLLVDNCVYAGDMASAMSRTARENPSLNAWAEIR